MARIKGAMMTRKRRKKVLKLAKGYYGAKSKLFRTAKQAVMKSGQYAYMNGMNYSTIMNGLKKAGVTLNRKMLSEIAIADPAAFTALTEQAKAANNQ